MKRDIAKRICAALTISFLLGACGGNTQTPAQSGELEAGEERADTSAEAQEAEAAPEGAVVMRIGHAQTEESPRHRSLLTFKEEVETKTSGGILVEIYPDGQLGDEIAMTVAVEDGTLEAVRGGDLDVLPESTALSLPMIADTIEEARMLCYSDFVTDMLSSVETNHNMKVLAVGDDSGFRQITNSVHEIRKPADMKGLKLRVPPLYVMDKTITEFGASTKTVQFTELYDKLASGEVDGQENPLALIDSSRFYEVQKYCTIIDYMFCVELMYVNLDWWETLPAEYQAILTAAARSMMDENARITDQENESYIRHIQENGCKVYTLTAEERDAFKPLAERVWESYVDDGYITKSDLNQMLAVVGKSVSW